MKLWIQYIRGRTPCEDMRTNVWKSHQAVTPAHASVERESTVANRRGDEPRCQRCGQLFGFSVGPPLQTQCISGTLGVQDSHTTGASRRVGVDEYPVCPPRVHAYFNGMCSPRALHVPAAGRQTQCPYLPSCFFSHCPAATSRKRFSVYQQLFASG